MLSHFRPTPAAIGTALGIPNATQVELGSSSLF